MSNQTLAETIEKDGYRAELHWDSDPVNPRKDYDHLGTLFMGKMGYLSDDDAREPGELWREYATEDEARNYILQWVKKVPFETAKDTLKDCLCVSYADTLHDYLEWFETSETYGTYPEAVVVLPVYMYQHGNIAINTTGFLCPWDSGQVGYIYTTLEKAREWLVPKGETVSDIELIEKAEKALRREVEEFGQYLEGETYGIKIFDQEGEEIDSVWGFIGFDYAKDEAKAMLDALISKKDD